MARRGYVQLVNGFYDNDKVRDLVRMGRADSVGVYCMALSLCGDRLTDGFIPRRAMLSNIGATPEQVRALVDEGMLEEVDEGWIIHDYTVHNRTKEQVLHARADAKERKSKSRCHATVTSMSQRDSAVTSGQTPEHQNELSKDNSTPPTPSKPDFDGLLDSLERIYPTNRFDGKTSQARMQLEIEWPKIVKAAGEADPFEFLEAKTRAYVGATEERFVKTFSRFIGGELYARNWEKPKPETPRARQVQPVKSRSQQNLEANMAKTWQYMTEEERARYSQGGLNAQQG
ncbi:hypothetical protein GBK56_10380 [Bifidobacterium longum]|uniref:Uncharacterized protein n=1 Tax=Bifidobacterium longum TaxID=216816 RepID=A0A6A2SEE9_BIFLN|nr:hypothetical protein GBL14_07615 [Bifidobacterium longum]KAB6780257.1 hypothetical protein GBL21_10685 [Bifidobacterium longum]KAB6782602.1 hypothetical protein GBL04_10640 [Bifidobacterium longum]KAB6785091.1 hypothetical protein GBK77_10600 [Bifidobacterium longum]KAB6788735.1 hypothetical protein GBK96_09390 [Bifidobacterium longum]